jgi:hypothetical protein
MINRAAELSIKRFTVTIKPVPTFERADTDPLFIRHYGTTVDRHDIKFSLMFLASPNTSITLSNTQTLNPCSCEFNV